MTSYAINNNPQSELNQLTRHGTVETVIARVDENDSLDSLIPLIQSNKVRSKVYKNTTMHPRVITAYRDAVRMGQVKVLNVLLKNGVDPNEIPEIPLFAFENKNSVEVLRKLIEYGLDINTFYKSTNLLERSVFKTKPLATKFLLENGANPDSGKRNESPALFIAVEQNDLESAEALLKYGANVNAVNHRKKSVLAIALRKKYRSSKYKDMVELLLRYGATPDNPQAMLNQVARNGKIETAIKLVAKNSTLDLSAPLIQALRFNNINIAKYLLQKGADANGGSQPGMPLQMAASIGNVEMIELLMQQGAEINAESLNKKGPVTTPLTASISSGNLEAVRLLLEAGANSNHAVTSGFRPLMQALRRARENRLEIIKLLLEYGADPDEEDMSGMTVRMMAGIVKDDEITYLIEQSSPGMQKPTLSEPVYTYTLAALTSERVAPLLAIKTDNLKRLRSRVGPSYFSKGRKIEKAVCKSTLAYLKLAPRDGFKVLISICGHGPFDVNNIASTKKLSAALMKTLLLAKPAKTEKDREKREAMAAREKSLSEKEISYTYVGVLGLLNFVPTGVVIDTQNNTSFVVQFWGAEKEYMDMKNVETIVLLMYKMIKGGGDN